MIARELGSTCTHERSEVGPRSPERLDDLVDSEEEDRVDAGEGRGSLLQVAPVCGEVRDEAEESAVRALAGEAPITGRLPIALPGLFEAGHGLAR